MGAQIMGCPGLKFVPADQTLPIHLFLATIEHDGLEHKMADAEIVTHALSKIDASELDLNQLKSLAWPDLKTHLVKLFHTKAETGDMVDLLGSLNKSPEENSFHYLLRVRYVVNLILESVPCLCARASDTWERLLFFSGLPKAERNACGASNPASLESLAALMNNMRKVEQDPDENFTPDELATDVKVDFSGGFNAVSAHLDPPLPEDYKVESKDLSDDCGAAAAVRAKRKRGQTDFHDESDSAHDDEKVDIAENAALLDENGNDDEDEEYFNASTNPAKRRRKVYSMKKPSPCPHCDQVCRTKGELNRHVTLQHKRVNVTCNLCKEQVSKIHFIRHCKTQHGGMTERCDECSALFPSIKKLEKHREIQHQSDIAAKVAEGLVTIQRNPQANQPSQSIEPTTIRGIGDGKKTEYRCCLCTATLIGTRAFRKHCEDLHQGKRYGCDLCPYSANSKERIYDHRLRIHSLVTQGCTIYTCKCGYKTTCHIQLKTHLREKHSEVDQAKVTCETCHKEFRSEAAKIGHIEKVHLNLRPYPCEKCGKCFKELRMLNEHQITHRTEDEKQIFLCNECGTSFERKCYLRNHVSRMHGSREKNYHCEDCQKSFLTSPELKRHVRVYHPEKQDKRYQCPHCQRFLENNSKLTKHVNIVHLKVKAYHCKLCDVFYANGKTLAVHIASKHLGMNQKEAKGKQRIGRKHEAFEYLPDKLHKIEPN